MFVVKSAHKVSMNPKGFLLSLFCMIALVFMSACGGENASNAETTPVVEPTPTPNSVQVEGKPKITVKGENASQITLVGWDVWAVSTSVPVELAYDKANNQVTVNLSGDMTENVEIKIPMESTLDITLTGGNIAISDLNGQLSLTLDSGTIRVQDFTPVGKSTISTKNGTIEVVLSKNAACSLTAETDFGAIVSGYDHITEQRTDMKAKASGTIGEEGSDAELNLISEQGSITVRPA